MAASDRAAAASGFAAALAIVLALALPLVPRDARAAVIGKDERTSLPVALSALKGQIGLLSQSGTGRTCTAFCVAPDTVATAGHCLEGSFDAGRPDPALTFGFGYEESRRGVPATAAARASTRSALPAPATQSARTPIRLDATSDWALLTLAAPVCQGRTLPLVSLPADDVMELAASGRVHQVGYHQDLSGWPLALGRACHVGRRFEGASWDDVRADFLDAENLLLHTCDTGGSSSGSPLLAEIGGRLAVVGMNVGTYVRSQAVVENGRIVGRLSSRTIANTAIAITPLVEALRRMPPRAIPARHVRN